jgi:hypothetical protein
MNWLRAQGKLPVQDPGFFASLARYWKGLIAMTNRYISAPIRET